MQGFYFLLGIFPNLLIPDTQLAVTLAALLVSTAAAGFLARKTFLRMTSRDRRLLLKLIFIYISFVILTRFGFMWSGRSWWLSRVTEIAFSLLGGATTVAIFAIAVVVIRTFWPHFLGRSGVRLTPLGPSAIDTYVKEILDSNSFITALNESLPRGVDDAEFGLDSVPYLLSSIRTRRERLGRSTQRFLRLTITAASVTAVIISFFAWVLVNDESVGAPRALRALRENTDSLASSLRYLNSDYRQTAEFARLSRAINAKVDSGNVATKAELQAILRRAAAGAPLADVVAALRPAAGALRYDTPNYGNDIDSAMLAMDTQNTERRAALERIGQLQPRLNALIDRVTEELGKDQNRVAEVIRRIALGLIVATFFLAIIRFVANLYRADYNQLLRADFDDMLVRSFYVTFKASEGLGNQRSAVLSSYISALSTFAPPKTPDEDKGFSKEDSDLLKTLLEAVAKKL